MNTQVDCALVTALPKELDKLLFHFRHSISITENSRVFYETTTPSGIKLVGSVAQGVGQINAVALVSDLIRKYEPKTVILVGITGGLDRNIKLGDVVISSQIIDYEIGKITPSGLDIRWSVYPVDSSLLNKALSYRNNSWVEYIRTPRPDEKGKAPSCHIGLYLSGNKVIADEKAAGALLSFWKRASAIEMEAAGIAAILRQMPNPPGFITMKGVCDYADSNKSDLWQEYAADAAASFAYSFINDLLLPDFPTSAHKNNELEFPNFDFRALRVLLQDTYNLAELNILCGDLNIDWEDIPGRTKSEKIVELIRYLSRRNKLNELVEIVNKDRNNILTAYVSK